MGTILGGRARSALGALAVGASAGAQLPAGGDPADAETGRRHTQLFPLVASLGISLVNQQFYSASIFKNRF